MADAEGKVVDMLAYLTTKRDLLQRAKESGDEFDKARANHAVVALVRLRRKLSEGKVEA